MVPLFSISLYSRALVVPVYCKFSGLGENMRWWIFYLMCCQTCALVRSRKVEKITRSSLGSVPRFDFFGRFRLSNGTRRFGDGKLEMALYVFGVVVI